MCSGSILILGGGCFGLTAALELRSRGWKVTLIDQGPLPHPDAASTDISKIVRMDYGRDAQHTDMGLLSIERWHQWNDRWGRNLYHEEGFLMMSRSQMTAGGFEHDSFSHLRGLGRGLHRMNSALLREAHPAWNADLHVDGYFNPIGGWVESGRVIARLAKEAQEAGIRIIPGVKEPRLLVNAGTCTGITSGDDQIWSADLVLASTGAWTPEILPHLQNVMWTTAQTVMHFKPRRPEDFRAPAFPVWAADIAKTGWYGFPANADGLVKVANHGVGRRVRASAPRELPPGEEARYRAFLRENFPSLGDAPLHSSRICLYCDTFDGAFWINHDRQIKHLVVAAGDSGHAFKFTPLMGGIIADVVEDKPNPWTQRYAWREPVAGAADRARAMNRETTDFEPPERAT